MVYINQKFQPEASIEAILFPYDTHRYQGTLHIISPFQAQTNLEDGVESVPLWISVPQGHQMDSPYARLIKPIAKTRLQERVLPHIRKAWFQQFEIQDTETLKGFISACPRDLVPQIRIRPLPLPTYRLEGTISYNSILESSYIS